MDARAMMETLKIKKYPNRRFYDATRSKHVTLDDLHQLVRAGHRIEVTDSDGRDITNVVLTQILLEHDPPKLDLFPASLLHQALQTNQEMVRRFIDEYFSKAMDSFLNSRKQFDEFLARAGLSPLQPLTPIDWARRFLQGFEQVPAAAAFGGASAATTGMPTPGPSASRPELDALRAELETLKAQLGKASENRDGAAARKRSARSNSGRRTRRR